MDFETLKSLIEVAVIVGSAVWAVATISATTKTLSSSVGKLDGSISDMRDEFKQLCEKIHMHDVRLTLLEAKVKIEREC